MRQNRVGLSRSSTHATSEHLPKLQCSPKHLEGGVSRIEVLDTSQDTYTSGTARQRHGEFDHSRVFPRVHEKHAIVWYARLDSRAMVEADPILAVRYQRSVHRASPVHRTGLRQWQVLPCEDVVQTSHSMSSGKSLPKQNGTVPIHSLSTMPRALHPADPIEMLLNTHSKLVHPFYLEAATARVLEHTQPTDAQSKLARATTTF
mmetsp:Transcript_16206/g.65490  ORF Transcript_16206/g.65490 Transcript_16206/m.65490 type:complete len:204 (-) Transcript_16206:2877-3488(-)